MLHALIFVWTARLLCRCFSGNLRYRHTGQPCPFSNRRAALSIAGMTAPSSRIHAIKQAIVAVLPDGKKTITFSAASDHSRRLVRYAGAHNVLTLHINAPASGWRRRAEADAAAYAALEEAVRNGLLDEEGVRWEWLHGRYGDRQCWFTRASTYPPSAVRTWHIPPTADNERMSMHKACARMDLMLSKTVPVARIVSVSGWPAVPSSARPQASEQLVVGEARQASGPAIGLQGAEESVALPSSGSQKQQCEGLTEPLPIHPQPDLLPLLLPDRPLPPVHAQALPDVLSSTGQVMTDGCAPAGLGVLRAVLASFALPHTQPAGYADNGEIDVLPQLDAEPGVVEGVHTTLTSSLFQGRIGGYKGVWYFDPRLHPTTLCLRPSQKKVDIPWHAASRSQMEVEVIRVAKDRGPAALNVQIAALLLGWGVSASTLLRLHSLSTVHLLSMSREEGAAAAVLRHVPRGDRDGQLGLGGQEQEVQAARMLDAGLWGEHRLASMVSKIRAKRMRAIVRRWGQPAQGKDGQGGGTQGGLIAAMAFPIAESRTVYVIADPTGLLQPGQCFLRVPSSVPHLPSTARPGQGHGTPPAAWQGHQRAAGIVQGPMLLARNPCHHPDHLQVVEGVSLVALWETARHRQGGGAAGDSMVQPTSALTRSTVETLESSLCNILVLPVTGAAPPISLLSGGDYDGDMVWCCWEGELVAQVIAGKARYVKGEMGAQQAPVHVAPPVLAKSKVQHATAQDLYLSSIRPEGASVAQLGLVTNLHLAWVDAYLEKEGASTRSMVSGQAREAEGSGEWDMAARGLQESSHGHEEACTPSTALWQPECLSLSSLCSSLVDAPKSGACAPPLPAQLRRVLYPHYMASPGSHVPARHSTSPLGLLAAAAAARAVEIGRELGLGLPVAPVTQREGVRMHVLQPWREAGTPWLPDVRLVHAARAYGVRYDSTHTPSMQIAEEHFRAFKRDIRAAHGHSHGGGGGGGWESEGPCEYEGEGSEEGSGSDSEGVYPQPTGGSGSAVSGYERGRRAHLEVIRRARARLLYSEDGSAEGFWGGGLRARRQEDVYRLALAYYMTAWQAYQQAWQLYSRTPGAIHVPQPYAFPWTVAGSELLDLLSMDPPQYNA